MEIADYEGKNQNRFGHELGGLRKKLRYHIRVPSFLDPEPCHFYWWNQKKYVKYCLNPAPPGISQYSTGIRPPPIARTNGRSEAHEGALERSQQDLSDVHSKFVLKGQASGQSQVKGHGLGSPLRRPQRPFRC